MTRARAARRSLEKPSLWARLLVSIWLLAVPLHAAALASPSIGASIDLALLPAGEQTAMLTRLALSGVTAIRLPLDWNRVEPQPGEFHWEAADVAITEARAHGLDVTLVLGPVAEWAVDPALGIPADQVQFSVPRSDALWERYVRGSAAHFQGRVKCWQVREQPNVRNFRGSASEYLHLLAIAARTLRSVDPSAVVILSEAVALDPAGLDLRLRPPIGTDWEVWGAYLPTGGDLSDAALAFAVMMTEVMPPGSPRPVWVVGAETQMPADRWVQYYLLSSAFGAERFYAPANTISTDWVPVLSRLRYLGFLQLGPEVWSLVFEDRQGLAVTVWSARDTRAPASAVAPIAELAQVRSTARLGDAPGSAVAGDAEDPVLLLGPRPVVVRGLNARPRAQLRIPTRADVLAARPGPDPSALTRISVDYSRATRPEQGLYNRVLRSLPGGAVREEPHPDRVCLGTHMRPLPQEATLDQPWIYFDVDDRWLYLARGETTVAITVECEASRLGPERVGFNLHYDSATGYRDSPWQWVDSGEGWWQYRVVLHDVSFTNRNGYDFRINAKGSKQDLWVASVAVEKLPADE